MAFNDVALDDRRMASAKRLRNAVFVFDRFELRIREIVRFNVITVFSQVTHPRDTTTSGRAFVNRDGRRRNRDVGEDK